MAQAHGSQLALLCAIVLFIPLVDSNKWRSPYDPWRPDGLTLLTCSALLSHAIDAWPSHRRKYDSSLGHGEGRSPSSRSLWQFAQASSKNLGRHVWRSRPVALLSCTLLRQQLYYYLAARPQCTQPGLWAYTPILMLIYETATSRQTRSQKLRDGDPEEMWSSFSDDLKSWLATSPTMQALGVGLISTGTFIAMNAYNQSSLFCVSSTNGLLLAIIQALSLCLDMCLLILSHQKLDLVKTSQSGRSLGCLAVVTWCSAILLLWRGHLFVLSFTDPFIGTTLLGLYLAFAAASPLGASLTSLAALFTTIAGIRLTLDHISLTAMIEGLSSFQGFSLLTSIALGFVLFLYSRDIKSVGSVPRFLVTVVLLLGIIFVMLQSNIGGIVLDSHPVRDLIYQARINFQHWESDAGLSTNLHTAVQEYKDRHQGRLPPPGFDKWFDFAKKMESPIIDHFPQVEADLSPFWKLEAHEIRERIRRIKQEPGIGILSIRNGTFVHGEVLTEDGKTRLNILMDLVQPFLENLADVELPLNLLNHPRVLISRQRAGRSVNQGSTRSTATFQRRLRLACPAGSLTRTVSEYDSQHLCVDCAALHSNGLYLRDAFLARDVCHQPDLLKMHDFYTHAPEGKLFDELVPVLSPFKTPSFGDILIPLTWAESEDDNDVGFAEKNNRLYWRGNLGIGATDLDQKSRYNTQAARLSHLVNNSTSADQVTMSLPPAGAPDRSQYCKIPRYRAKAALPFSMGISNYTGCTGFSCDGIQQELGLTSQVSSEAATQSRYILSLDADKQPPPDILRNLGSNSVPFTSTIFREWYSDRISPWLHYVPIDVRFHALHSTLAYFTGLKASIIQELNHDMLGETDDAKWIATQGRQWARTALRKEDAQVYLYRLLLEWARLIDDGRDEIGFELGG